MQVTAMCSSKNVVEIGGFYYSDILAQMGCFLKMCGTC